MKVYIDGKEWMETDYLTVNKDLHVKGDFTLDGGGSQAFDTIITGSFKVTGVSGLGTTPFTPRAVVMQALGTAPLRKGLQIRAPGGYKSRYFEVLAGSNENDVRFYIGTSQTVNYGTFISGRGSFRSMAPVITPLIGSFGSFTRLSVKGSARASRFYGSVGSFTRVIPGGAGSVGSFTRLTVTGSAYGRYMYGSIGSYTRVVGGFGSFGMIAVQGSARFHGPTNIPSIIVTAAAPEFVSSFTGDTNGTFVNPLGLVADGSFVYVADNNRARVQKRSKSNWSHQYTYSSTGWPPLKVGMVRLDPSGQRGSYVYVTSESPPEGYIKKLAVADLSLVRELFGSWQRSSGGYGTFYGDTGVTGYAGSVFIVDKSWKRVIKMDLGLVAGTVLIKNGVGDSAMSYPHQVATNGTFMFIINEQAGGGKIMKYNMAGSFISKINVGNSNQYPFGISALSGYVYIALYDTITPDNAWEKYAVSDLTKRVKKAVTNPSYGVAIDTTHIYVAEAGPAAIEKYTLGSGNITGAGLLVTTGSFESIVAAVARLHGTVKIDKFIGTFRRLIQAGSAAPGSAGYITYGKPFSAPPRAILTQKDAWAPTVGYGPRIKQTAAGSMMAFGSPAGYMWWQAVGSAF